MTSTTLKRAAGIFLTFKDAEQALIELRDAGFSLDQVSIVAKDANYRDQPVGADVGDAFYKAEAEIKDNIVIGSNQASKGAKVGAVTGAGAGALVGLVEGLAVLAVPGVGAATAIGILLGNMILNSGIGAGLGGLGGALVGWGIPEDRAEFYRDRVSQGDYLVVVEATEAEMQRAEAILNRRGIQEWGVYTTPETVGERQMKTISRQPGID